MRIRIGDHEFQRKQLRRSERDGDVRYITFSTYKRLPLLGHGAIRDLFVEHLSRVRVEHDLALYAWVVMPEHVHLVVRPAQGWAPVATSLKTEVSKDVLARWRELDAPILERISSGS